MVTADMNIRHDMTENEASLFHALLHPDDLYGESGVYWADLSLAERITYVGKVDQQEANKGPADFWNVFKDVSSHQKRGRTTQHPNCAMMLERW